MRGPNRVPAIGLAFALALSACSDEGRSPSELASRSPYSLHTSDPEMAALSELARLLSIALSEDPGLRNRVKNDLRASRFRENKLEFRTYLRGSGRMMVTRMARAGGVSPDEVYRLVQAVRPLEFYMPVRMHRASWRGDTDVIVAAQLDDDQPPHFYAAGAPVFIGPNEIPETPVLSLVPVETDFSRPHYPEHAPRIEDDGGATIGTYLAEAGLPEVAALVDECLPGEDLCVPGGGGGGGSGGGSPPPPPNYPPGIYFESMKIFDDHEPYLTKGDPEIDVYVSGTVRGLYVDSPLPGTTSPNLTYIPDLIRTLDADCAGSEAAGYRRFDFNGEGTFNKTTLIIDAQHFAVTEKIDAVNLPVTLMLRIVPLEPPFYIKIWERDDGNQCPEKRRTVEVQVTLRLSWVGGLVPLPEIDDVDWADIAWIWGGENDLVASWTIDSLDQFEAFNYTWLPCDRDGQLLMNNRGFSREAIPPYQEQRFF